MFCHSLLPTALPLLWASMSIWRGVALGLVSPRRGSCDAPCGSFLPLPFRRSGWIPLGASAPRSLRLTRDVDHDVTAPTSGASSAWLPLGGGLWRQTLSSHPAQVRTPLPSSRRLTHVVLAACIYRSPNRSQLLTRPVSPWGLCTLADFISLSVHVIQHQVNPFMSMLTLTVMLSALLHFTPCFLY